MVREDFWLPELDPAIGALFYYKSFWHLKLLEENGDIESNWSLLGLVKMHQLERKISKVLDSLFMKYLKPLNQISILDYFEFRIPLTCSRGIAKPQFFEQKFQASKQCWAPLIFLFLGDQEGEEANLFEYFCDLISLLLKTAKHC